MYCSGNSGNPCKAAMRAFILAFAVLGIPPLSHRWISFSPLSLKKSKNPHTFIVVEFSYKVNARCLHRKEEKTYITVGGQRIRVVKSDSQKRNSESRATSSSASAVLSVRSASSL